MHIEKNACESINGTLLNILVIIKDRVNSHMDLVQMGLRNKLAPKYGERGTYLPPICYTLTGEENGRVCKTLHDLKVSNEYSSIFINCVSMENLKL